MAMYSGNLNPGFKHKTVKGLLRGPTVSEAESLPDEPAADRTDHAYKDRADLSYTNDGNRRPGPATSVQKRSRRRSTDMAAWSSSELRAMSDSRSMRR